MQKSPLLEISPAGVREWEKHAPFVVVRHPGRKASRYLPGGIHTRQLFEACIVIPDVAKP